MSEMSEMIIKKRGRPVKSPDGIPNSKPIDKDYFNKYYHINLAVKIPCVHCSEMISKSKMNQHLQSKKCMNIDTSSKMKCLICSKYIVETRQQQHEKSKYCQSFSN
jgi:hypothetical protein